jgi:hypothetical protein
VEVMMLGVVLKVKVEAGLLNVYAGLLGE